MEIAEAQRIDTVKYFCHTSEGINNFSVDVYLRNGYNIFVWLCSAFFGVFKIPSSLEKGRRGAVIRPEAA